MGLRKLLGLPKPKSRRSAPDPDTPPDRSKYDAALQKYERLMAMPIYGTIDPDDDAALQRQYALATQDAGRGDFDEAAVTLSDAVALAAQALSRAKMNMERVREIAGQVSGMIDGARVVGVTTAELAGHVAAMNGVPGDDTLSSTQKRGRMEALLRAVDTDANIVAARAAHGRYLSGKSRVEAAGAKALEISTLPPIVNRLNPQLDDALRNMSAAAGSVNYRKAATEMDRAASLTTKIEAERARIAQAETDKKAAEDFHATIDAKVKRARTVVGFGAEEEAIVSLFSTIDQKYYAAMCAGNYRVALQTGKQLEKLVERVLRLEQRSKERLVVVAKVAEVFAQALALFKSLTLPDPTPIPIERADSAARAAAQPYFAAKNDDDYDAALIAATDFLAKTQAMKALIDQAPDVQRKFDEAESLWGTVKPRYDTIAGASYVSKAMLELQTEIKAAEVARAATDRNDVDAYLATVKAIETLADRVDAAAGDEAAAVKRKADLKVAYDAAIKEAEALSAFVAKGPALQGAIDAVVAQMTTLKALYARGDDTTEAQTAALTKLVKAADAAKAGDGAEAAAAKKLSDERWVAGKADRHQSHKLAVALPKVKEMVELRDKRRDLRKQAIAARKAEQWALSLSLLEQLDLVTADMISRHDALQKAYAEQGSEYKRRKGALDADIIAIKAFETDHGPAFTAATAALTRALSFVEYPETSKDWEWALRELPRVETAVAEGNKLKAKHAQAKLDRSHVVARKAAIGGDVDTLCTVKPTSIDSEDIIRRAINGKAVGDKTFATFDFATSKTYWDVAEAALTDWNVGGKDAAELAKDAMDPVVAQWSSMADRETALKVPAATPEAKEPVARLSAANGRFLSAYFAFDATTANLALDDMQAAIGPVMAIKAAADTAQLQHVVTRDAAAMTLASKSVDQLRAMTQNERRDLLEQLHSAGARMLDDEQKKQRAKLYDAMTVDPAFDRVDNERRNELVDALKADEDVKEARGKWGQMDLDAKLALLQKVMEKECEIYGIPVPTLRTFNEKPGDEGFFAGDKYTMNVNLHPMSGFSDFKEAVDTVVHETAHAYQNTLAKRVEDGLVGPGTPEYDEGKLFGQNFEGYVTPDDAKAAGNNTYNTQPVERHAWDTGGGVATELLSLPIEVEPGSTL